MRTYVVHTFVAIDQLQALGALVRREFFTTRCSHLTLCAARPFRELQRIIHHFPRNLFSVVIYSTYSAHLGNPQIQAAQLLAALEATEHRPINSPPRLPAW